MSSKVAISSIGSDFSYNLSLADKLYKSGSINEAKDVYIASVKLLISRQQAHGHFANEALSPFEATGVATAIANLADIHLNRSNDRDAEDTNAEIVSLVISLYPPKKTGFGILTFDSTDLNDRVATECATILINESDWRRDQGDYRSARSLIMLAHDICGKNVPPDHPVFAECLSCEASIMLAEGHSLEALQLADTGLAARRKHYPEGHLAIAASQYLKARALINLGRYEEASKLIAISAGIRKQNLGQNHPAVAQCLYCHAVIREIQGYPLEALEELKLTLELRSEHADTPAGHREIIESIIALAINAEKRGAYKKAQDLYERALKLTLEQLAGRGTIESLDVAEILVSLGNLYRTVGRYTDAAAMLGKAGIMICRMYGDDHLKLADCLYALAELAKATGQYRDAKVLLARCVTLRKEKLDAMHPLVASVLHATAENLWRMGYYSEASELGDSALISRVGVFGEEHPDVASSLLLRGCILRDIGEVSSAMTVMNRVLSLIRDRLGASHPLVASSLREIGECLRMAGRFDDAEQAVAEALRLRKAIFIESFESTDDGADSAAGGGTNGLSSVAFLADFKRRQDSTPVSTGLAEVADCLSCLGRIYIGKRNWSLAKIVYQDAALPMFLQAYEHVESTRSPAANINSSGAVDNDTAPDEHPQIIMARGCLGIAMTHDIAAEAPAGEQLVFEALAAFRRHKRAKFPPEHQWIRFLGGYPSDLLEEPDGFEAEEIEEAQFEADEMERMRLEEERSRELARIWELNVDRERVSMEREDVVSRQVEVSEREARAKELEERLRKGLEELARKKKEEEDLLAVREHDMEEKKAQEEAELAARAAALAEEQERLRQEAERRAHELAMEERRIVVLAAIEGQKKIFAETLETEERKLIHAFMAATAVHVQDENFNKRIRDQEIELAKQRLELESELALVKQQHELELTRRLSDSAVFLRARDANEFKMHSEAMQEDTKKFREHWQQHHDEDTQRLRNKLLEVEKSTAKAIQDEIASSQRILREEMSSALQSYEDWRADHSNALSAFNATLGREAILHRLSTEKDEDFERVRIELENEASLSKAILVQQARQGVESHERRLMRVEDDAGKLMLKLDKVSAIIKKRLQKEEELVSSKLTRQADIIHQSNERRLMQGEDDLMHIIDHLEDEALSRMKGMEGKAEKAREARERRGMMAEEDYEKKRLAAWAAMEAERIRREMEEALAREQREMEEALARKQREIEEALAREREREQSEAAAMRKEEVLIKKILAAEREAAEQLRTAQEREEKRRREEEEERRMEPIRRIKEQAHMQAEEEYEWSRLAMLAAIEAEKLRQEKLRESNEILMMKVEDEAELRRRHIARELKAQLAVLEYMERETMAAEETYTRYVLRKQQEERERRRKEQEDAERLLREIGEQEAMALEENTGIVNRKLYDLDLLRFQEELSWLQQEESRLLRERLEEERRRIVEAQKEREENDRKRREARRKKREEDEIRAQQSRELFEKELLETQRRAKAYKFNFAAVCAGLRDDAEEVAENKDLGTKVRESPFSTPLKMPSTMNDGVGTARTIGSVGSTQFASRTVGVGTGMLFSGNLEEQAPLRKLQESFDEEADRIFARTGKRPPRSAFGDRSYSQLKAEELSKRPASGGNAGMESDDEFNVTSLAEVSATIKKDKASSPAKSPVTKPTKGSPLTIPENMDDRRKALESAPAALIASKDSFDFKDDEGSPAAKNNQMARTSPVTAEICLKDDDESSVDSLASNRWAMKMPVGQGSKKLGEGVAKRAIVDYNVLDEDYINWAKPGRTPKMGKAKDQWAAQHNPAEEESR